MHVVSVLKTAGDSQEIDKSVAFICLTTRGCIFDSAQSVISCSQNDLESIQVTYIVINVYRDTGRLKSGPGSVKRPRERVGPALERASAKKHGQSGVCVGANELQGTTSHPSPSLSSSYGT